MGYHSSCQRVFVSHVCFSVWSFWKTIRAHEKKKWQSFAKVNFFEKIEGALPIFIFHISICFFHDTVICEAVNNCSNHGTCAGPNLCSCEKGFHGADCSKGKWMRQLTNIMRWWIFSKEVMHTKSQEQRLQLVHGLTSGTRKPSAVPLDLKSAFFFLGNQGTPFSIWFRV